MNNEGLFHFVGNHHLPGKALLLNASGFRRAHKIKAGLPQSRDFVPGQIFLQGFILPVLVVRRDVLRMHGSRAPDMREILYHVIHTGKAFQIHPRTQQMGYAGLMRPGQNLGGILKSVFIIKTVQMTMRIHQKHALFSLS